MCTHFTQYTLTYETFIKYNTSNSSGQLCSKLEVFSLKKKKKKIQNVDSFKMLVYVTNTIEVDR